MKAVQRWSSVKYRHMRHVELHETASGLAVYSGGRGVYLLPEEVDNLVTTEMMASKVLRCYLETPTVNFIQPERVSRIKLGQRSTILIYTVISLRIRQRRYWRSRVFLLEAPCSLDPV
jgi:hypothetical protein